MKRRSFIITLGATAATLALPPLAAHAQRSRRAQTATFAQAVREAYEFKPGHTWPSKGPKDWTPERAMRFLTDGLSPTEISNLIEDHRALAKTISARIRRDEAAGAIASVRGWIVTETEAAAITLIATTESTSA